MPPLSAILLSQPNGRRAIVHHRDTPEYGLDDFARLDLSRWRWAHFEARPGPETERMVRHAHFFRPDLLISIEVEKVRPGIEVCFPMVRLVLFSRGYVEACGFPRPEAFLREMRGRVPHTLMSAAWGDEGAWAIEADGTLHHAPAVPPPAVIDTIGAGDTFNAGHDRGAGRGTVAAGVAGGGMPFGGEEGRAGRVRRPGRVGRPSRSPGFAFQTCLSAIFSNMATRPAQRPWIHATLRWSVAVASKKTCSDDSMPSSGPQ